MTVLDLKEKLNAYPDDLQVAIFNYKKNLINDGGEGSNEGVYKDFEVIQLNDDLSEDEKSYCLDVQGMIPDPVIVLSFNDKDIEIYNE